jgi:hypothetical protein
MNLRPFFSSLAIECHLLCLGGIGIFSYALLSGDKTWPERDYKIAIVSFAVVYLVLLSLIWLMDKNNRREKERERTHPTPAPKAQRQRARMRNVMLIFIYAASGYFIYMGYKGWLIDSIPAHYLGFLLIGMATLGVFRVNIWFGGPLDLRLDSNKENPPKPENIEDVKNN